jgi:transposase
MHAMGRKEQPSGQATRCILPKPASDLAPQLITHVETTPSSLRGAGVVSEIHADLAEKELLPDQHLVDSGYVTAINLVKARSAHRVDLVGPTLKTHWYQAETGYDITNFSIDWEANTVTCPAGRISSSWTPVQNNLGKPLVQVKFSISDCRACSSRTLWTGTTRRSISLQPREQMQALFAARKREETDAWKRHLSPSSRH